MLVQLLMHSFWCIAFGAYLLVHSFWCIALMLLHVACCRLTHLFISSLRSWACLTASNRKGAQHDNGGVCAVELPRLASQGAGVFEGQARTRPASWRSRRTCCCCFAVVKCSMSCFEQASTWQDMCYICR